MFDTTNFRREWIKAGVKLGLGKKTSEEWHQYDGLIPHDFRHPQFDSSGSRPEHSYENHKTSHLQSSNATTS